MKKLPYILLALILSACNLASPSITFPTGTPDLSTLVATLFAESSPVSSTATPASSIPTLPADPFTANYLQLPQPVCSSTTPQQAEGPYYKQGSPERKVLLASETQGERLLVAGYVVDQNCQPVSSAWLDFWQADAAGAYDNTGYGFRGHQFADDQGRYFLETVVPGLYTGRTEHIHVKIQPPGGQMVTTQLYFPNVPQNSSDGIFNPALLVTLEEREGLYVAYYNFVITR